MLTLYYIIIIYFSKIRKIHLKTRVVPVLFFYVEQIHSRGVAEVHGSVRAEQERARKATHQRNALQKKKLDFESNFGKHLFFFFTQYK